uniref:Uncharacterized protein n=1 Tax=Chenopodium quinoa TaxID=63459 RepID=A0A803MB38_CHEQI
MVRRCRNFANLIENNKLLDLGCSGPKHTRFRGNSLETFKSARLDRGLSNEEWRIMFPEGAIRNLPKSRSDHYRILNSNRKWVQCPALVKTMISDYWTKLFQEELSDFVGERLLLDQFPFIADEDREVDSKLFASCEVKKALVSMKAFEAPGPDGF